VPSVSVRPPAFAAARAYAGLQLHTFAELTPACALYRAVGFTLTASGPGTRYGPTVTEQTYTLFWPRAGVG